MMGMDRVLQKKKWPKKKIISYSLFSVLFILFAYWILFKVNSRELTVNSVHLTIATVKSGPFLEFIPVIGTIQPQNTIYLDAVEGGRVEKIFLRAGSKLEKGDRILKLSNTQLLMTLLNNEAQINRAGNELRATRLLMEKNRLDLKNKRADADYFFLRAKRKFERNKKLIHEKMISQQAYDDYRDEYEYLLKKRKITIESQERELIFQEQQVKDLEASVKQMKLNLKLLQRQMENLTVCAPVSGHLTSLNAELGQSKSPGERLGQIDEMDGFKVRAKIDEHFINRIREDKMGQFDVDGNSHQLKVKTVFPEVNDGGFQVEMIFEGSEPAGVRRGQTIHIRLQISEVSRALLLPRGGFYQKTGGSWVYVLEESGNTAVKRNLRLGRQNPQFFEIIDGLKEGERVITSSYENFGNIERLILN